jgi:hypothetical protein
MSRHRLGHLAFSKMKEMAKMRIIAAKFANCDIPACMYGKATRKLLRKKSSNHKKSVKVDESTLLPGEIICVDHMESKVPRFIAKMKEWLTKKRYKFAWCLWINAQGLHTYIFNQLTEENRL